ncbi:winged helix-turn-helix domain-containing protein [Roseibium sp.]|uniref:winged helix-turn-helix domain-containing protein n=1 Tax=Roseibium sp. TaxID=1936156 RepID=UPI003D0D38F7
MQDHAPDQFTFCDFTLDLQTRSLLRRGQEISLRPKSFDVLAHLVANSGRLVSRDEILEAAWQKVIASDESLSRCISDARSAIGDDSKEVIRTVPGRGYHFTADVSAHTRTPNVGAWKSEPGPSWQRRSLLTALGLFLLAAAVVIGITTWKNAPPELAATQSIHPSIVVLPFKNNSADTAIDRFAAGLTSDLNSALARIPALLVISESTARRYAGGQVDPQQAAKETGAQYVLSGIIQAEGRQLRITAQLVEGGTGMAVWSRRYDRGADDFLRLQDDIVRQVIINLQIELTEGEAIRIVSRGTNNLEAWLLNTEALAEGFTFKRENTMKARQLYREAAQLDPDWAAPVSGLAWTYREAIRRGWSTDVMADRAKWLDYAEKCQKIDPDFFGCYIQLGNYHIENGQIGDGIRLREKALELAPNDLSALSGLAWQLVLIGQVERGLELLNRAKLVSPFHPPWLIATEAYAYQLAGRYDEAIASYQYALEHGDFPDWHGRIAAVYAEIGDMENARTQARIFIEKQPNRRVSDLTQILKIQAPEVTAHYAEMLRKAGIPD